MKQIKESIGLNDKSIFIYTVFQRKTATLFLVITYANINRFSKFFYRQIPKVVRVAMIAISTSP